MTKAADSRSMSWPTSAAANTPTVVRRRPHASGLDVRGRDHRPASCPRRTHDAGAELHRREVSLADRAQAQDEPAAPRRARPDWSGCATAEGLNRAAASTANSWVNQAPDEAAAFVRELGGLGYPVRDLRVVRHQHTRQVTVARRVAAHRPASGSIRPRRRAARGSSTAPPRPGTDRRARARDRARTAARARAPGPRSASRRVRVTHSVTRRPSSTAPTRRAMLQRREQRQSGLGALVLVAPDAFQTVEAATADAGSCIGVPESLSPRNHAAASVDPVGPPPSAVDRLTPPRRRRPTPPPRSAAGRTPGRRPRDRSRRPGPPTDARPWSAGRAASPTGRGRPRRATGRIQRRARREQRLRQRRRSRS